MADGETRIVYETGVSAGVGGPEYYFVEYASSHLDDWAALETEARAVVATFAPAAEAAGCAEVLLMPASEGRWSWGRSGPVHEVRSTVLLARRTEDGRWLLESRKKAQ